MILRVATGVDEGLISALTRASGRIEARAVGDAFVALVGEGSSQAAQDGGVVDVSDNVATAHAMAAALDERVNAARSSADIAAAFRAFRDDVRGSVDGGVTLTGLLGIDADDGYNAAVAVAAVVDAGAEFDASIDAIDEDADNGVTALDFAAAVYAAYAAFDDHVAAAVADAIADADVDVVTGVFVVSEGAWG